MEGNEMVQRYRNQINEAATPAAFGRNYVDGAATGVYVAGALAGAGEEIRRFAEVRKRRQDEWDAATVMNAQTEYARQMTEWMDDPETGKLQTQKLGAARGLTDETFRYADELAEKIAGGLENENQKAAFLRSHPISGQHACLTHAQFPRRWRTDRIWVARQCSGEFWA